MRPDSFVAVMFLITTNAYSGHSCAVIPVGLEQSVGFDLSSRYAAHEQRTEESPFQSGGGADHPGILCCAFNT